MPSTIHHPPSTPIFLAGPTAAGKSAVALALAERLGGEIITVDSMQVYRGLDIGTAKPSAEALARVRHHVIDVVDLTAQFDAAAFLRHACDSVAEISARGRIPIFCGGTGLYFKAWINGLDPSPASDPKLRAELEAAPLAALLHELASNAPAVFGRIDRQNPRRVVRAVEVLRLAGQQDPLQQSSSRHSSHPSHVPLFCLKRTSDDLRTRINTRVDSMFGRGLVAETESLLARGLAGNRTAMQAIGYRQVAEHLRGERDLSATVALVKAKTWQFARRQMSWFCNQLDVEWIGLTPEEGTDEAVAKIESALRGG